MQKKAFTIFDATAEMFLVPFFMPREAEAVRFFSNLVADKDTNVGKNPDDFILYEFGTFEDGTAVFTAVEPRRIISGREIAIMIDPGMDLDKVGGTV